MLTAHPARIGGSGLEAAVSWATPPRAGLRGPPSGDPGRDPQPGFHSGARDWPRRLCPRRPGRRGVQQSQKGRDPSTVWPTVANRAGEVGSLG